MEEGGGGGEEFGLTPSSLPFPLYFAFVPTFLMNWPENALDPTSLQLASCMGLQEHSWVFSIFKPAKRMLLIYAYEFTLVQDPILQVVEWLV